MSRLLCAAAILCAALAGCEGDIVVHPDPNQVFDDPFEPNDTISTAALLSGDLIVGDRLQVLNLAGFDDDWFEVDTLDAGNMTVMLRDGTVSGDMDLFVFNSSGVLLGSSATSSITETIVLIGAPAGRYFILAQPFILEDSYDLQVDLATSTLKPAQKPALDPAIFVEDSETVEED